MRVLVVEDEHKIAQAIKRGLEQETYAVDLAFDGKTGLDLALSETFDLIILDLLLPEIDGLEILKYIRKNKIQVPVLILTAKGQLEDKVSGLNSGADDYLVKPFAFEELLARIRALIRRPQNHTGIVLRIDNLTLNTINFEVRRDNRIINLTGKEYALLEFLMRHPNEIFSKNQIINHVWSYDSDVLPNSVEVYIGYLRKKIDRPFKRKKLLQTVRGFGYKISKEK